MGQKLIIIRGNSGSGKTTVASRVRDALPGRVMFLSQDILRRRILRIEDKEGNPCIGLIENLVIYGKSIGYDIVLEGILSKKKYGEMLSRILGQFDETYVYYFDVPFEETLRRHQRRAKSSDFGEAEMRDWWKDADYLCVPGETRIEEGISEDDLVTRILQDTRVISAR